MHSPPYFLSAWSLHEIIFPICQYESFHNNHQYICPFFSVLHCIVQLLYQTIHVFTAVFHVQAAPFRNRIFRMELSAIMIDRTFSCHSADCSFYEPLLLRVVQIQIPDTPSFFTFVKSKRNSTFISISSRWYFTSARNNSCVICTFFIVSYPFRNDRDSCNRIFSALYSILSRQKNSSHDCKSTMEMSFTATI